MSNKEVFLCALSNISSGNCSEDCKFCTQSARNKVDINKYKKKPIEVLVKEAKAAKENQARGFCLVTAGVSLSSETKAYVMEAAEAIKKEVNINLIGCNGLAKLEDLKDLKSAGIDAYNHNLEAEKSYYKEICSTHNWEERYVTCQNVNEAGLALITGGIFGLGESAEQREAFFAQIRSLNPKKVPLNFFIPNEELPIKQPVMSPTEAKGIIQRAREVFPDEVIMVAGGREVVFGENWLEIFEAGANSIVIGDYLTAKGFSVSSDREKILNNGFIIG